MYLIEQFSSRGRADLIAEYAQLVPLLVFNDLFGCPAEIGDRLVYGISCLFDGVDVEKANEILTESLFELVTLKRTQPGEDITSWLMQHEARLTDEEMIHQLVMLIEYGTEPTQNIIASALRLLLSDDKYAGGQHSAGLLVEDAINDVLWNGPPIANYAAHYPLYDVDLSGTTVRARRPGRHQLRRRQQRSGPVDEPSDAQQARAPGVGRGRARLSRQGPRAADRGPGDREAAQHPAGHRSGGARGHAHLAAGTLPPRTGRTADPLYARTQGKGHIQALRDRPPYTGKHARPAGARKAGKG